MSVSTTLRLSPVPSAEKLQFYQSNISSSNLNNNNNTSPYYHYPQENTEEHEILLKNDTSNYTYTALPSEDELLLERASLITNASASSSPFSSHSSAAQALHKSNSYNGMSSIIKPKSTILKQDSVNGRIATSLTDDDIIGDATSSAVISFRDNVPGEGIEEDDAFLVCPPNNTAGGSSGSNSNSSSRRGTRSSVHGKSARTNICIRVHAFINRNWYLSYLVPLSILLALMFVAYLTRDYAKRLLYWIETQNPWVIFAIFMLLFILVSFPVVVGYFVLMITSGYLFGCLKGFLTVILGANIGIAIAHVTIRSFRHRIPMHKLIKNETGRAILRVISGPRAFKVVLFTRLTPIPFGIQNAIFGVSSINLRVYHSATFLGLLPAQTINVYLGSTLRSMHEVLNNHGTAVTGYISFGVEVICGVALMFWVVQKARKELSETLLSDISTDGKLIDIEV